MADITLRDRLPFRGIELLVMGGILIGGEVLGIAVAFMTAPSEVSKAFSEGAAALFFGSLLGGIVTLLMAELDRHRVQRAAEVEYISNLLNDLKAVYDQVDRGRTMIAAARSARTYHLEMQNMIQARVKLLQVVRALTFDPRGSILESEIKPHVVKMESYLKELVSEYERKYKDISLTQSVFEARLEAALKDAASSKRSADPDLPENSPWERIRELPICSDFLSPLEDSARKPCSSQYNEQFVESLDAASSGLRKALSRELGSL